MLIAQIVNGNIAKVIDAPTQPGYENGQWRDFSNPAVLAAWMEEFGWVEVEDVPQPEETDTHRHYHTVKMEGGVPTMSWNAVAKINGRQTMMGGMLYEQWDDDTRTYTRYDVETGEQVEERPYTPEEHQRADEEFASAAALTSLEARVAALEAIVMAAPVPDDPASPTVPTWADLVPAGWWYDGTLLRDGGKVWRNVSGTVLTTPPSGFPGAPSQWTHLFVEVTATDPDPDPDPTHPEGYVGLWSADATYKVGDVVERDGVYYRCLVAHGPEYQGTWGPPQGSVWTDLGPVG